MRYPLRDGLYEHSHPLPRGVVNYSSTNEDWRTERRALAIGQDDSVLAITGADRPLNLLLDDPAQVVAVDANPAQNALLRLKGGALASLPFDDYLAFLGWREAADRMRLFREIHGVSDPWEAQMIARGVLYEGRWERFYRRLSQGVGMLRGRTVRRLFQCRDLEEQRQFVRTIWDRAWWRYVFQVTCSPWVSRAFFGDPAYYAHVDPGMSVGRYLYEGMGAALDRTLARENFMLSLVFCGRLPEEDLPPWLVRETAGIIRSRLNRLEIVTADVIRFLEQTSRRFTRFSLSDVPSFLDAAGFERLLDAMVGAAVPGARFCIRQFLTVHTVPSRFDGILVREPRLEGELQASDRAFAYRFIVGTVACPTRS